MLKSWIRLVSAACLGWVSAGAFAAAPIRVLIFNSCGSGGYVHPIGQQTPQIKEMLLNPAGANLQNPVIPPGGFMVDSIGIAQNAGTEAGHELIQALPAHDVLICVNNSSFANLFNAEDKLAFLAWAQAEGHGVVALHAATMDNGQWPQKIQYFGAEYIGWRLTTAQVLEDSTPGNFQDPHFLILHDGLDSQYTVIDEWMSFKTQPRSVPGIHVVTTVNEGSYLDKPDDFLIMGDHPISWYRAPALGGRFYYNAGGHDWTTFRDNYPFRRQIYNGVLWASGWNTTQLVSIRSGAAREPRELPGGENMDRSGSRLTVSISGNGPHSIVVYGLDGKVKARARGQGAQVQVFSGLPSGSVYMVVVSTPGRTFKRLLQPR